MVIALYSFVHYKLALLHNISIIFDLMQILVRTSKSILSFGISLRLYAVNLSGLNYNGIDAYAVLK